MAAWPPLRAASAQVPLLSADSGWAAEPHASLCVVRRSESMNNLEQRLRFAMVAYIGGNRPSVSCEQVSVALAAVGVPASAASVHLFAPEDFLVVFSSAEHRNRVAALPELVIEGAPLFFRQWNRQSQATQVSLGTKIMLAVEGLPPHAWETETVEDLLGKACAVVEIAPETRTRADMSLFKLSAWTSDLDSVPVARTLVVPEPAAAPPVGGPAVVGTVADSAGVVSLRYKILVHVVAVEEEMSLEERRRLPPSSGDHGRAAEEEAGGQARRCWRPRPWKRGAPDQRGTAFGGSSRQRAVLAPEPPVEWRLPVVSSPAPLVAPACRTGQQTGPVEGPVAGDADKTVQRPVAAKATLPVSSPAEPEILPNSTVLIMQTNEEVEIEAIETLPPLKTGYRFEAGKAGSAADPRPSGDTTGVRDVPFSTVERDIGKEQPSMRLSENSGEDSGSWATTGAESDPTAVREDVPVKSSVVEGHVESAERLGFIQISISGSAFERDKRRLEDTADSVDSIACLEEDSPVLGSPCMSYTGPNSNMQMVPRLEGEHARPEVDNTTELSREEASAGHRERNGMSESETIAFAKIKAFCANILKTLAPPLLKEVQGATRLCAEAEPFTPRRLTRRSAAIATGASTTRARKASAGETVLLHTLGIVPSDLSVNEEDLQIFKGIFDSPIREQQLRVMASIFGKVMPRNVEEAQGGRMEVSAR
ncbi:hypothetical protein QYE76_051311 [Lolium multiflorum]|uniref:DUF4283 domain-containing protein n=1 Tax=Lolium multiflorum TaxID=4521 RepID=A0AAD8ST42_LOLMU|nr:hypothetical protein QYE76_051311 [Lolium multiflorum]